ncbi:MAG: hypothetical protein SCK29_14940, partial [Bacillota bacterium]|nr:hypothetical protein [Bacillota bacterium]
YKSLRQKHSPTVFIGYYRQRLAESTTKELLQNIKDFHNIQQNISFSQGIVYNSAKVEIHFLETLSQVNSFLMPRIPVEEKLFFRGHSNPNYILRPSIMRSSHLERNESKMYHELIINCP